jgi:hypothetical protein
VGSKWSKWPHFFAHEDLQMLELFSGEQELTRQGSHLATQTFLGYTFHPKQQHVSAV